MHKIADQFQITDIWQQSHMIQIVCQNWSPTSPAHKKMLKSQEWSTSAALLGKEKWLYWKLIIKYGHTTASQKAREYLDIGDTQVCLHQRNYSQPSEGSLSAVFWDTLVVNINFLLHTYIQEFLRRQKYIRLNDVEAGSKIFRWIF